jgi:hypothetical protein
MNYAGVQGPCLNNLSFPSGYLPPWLAMLPVVVRILPINYLCFAGAIWHFDAIKQKALKMTKPNNQYTPDGKEIAKLRYGKSIKQITLADSQRRPRLRGLRPSNSPTEKFSI